MVKDAIGESTYFALTCCSAQFAPVYYVALNAGRRYRILAFRVATAFRENS